MKNSVSKGILYYIFVLLAVVMGVACIFGCILVFSPGTYLFGICYVNGNVEVRYDRVDSTNPGSQYLNTLYNSGLVKNISLTSDIVGINVITSNEDRLYVFLDGTINGIAKKGANTKYSVNYSYDDNTKTFSFDIKAPECVVYFNRGATITLIVPQKITLQNTALNITTDSGYVELGGGKNEYLCPSDVSVKVNNATTIALRETFYISKSLNINCMKGSIYLHTRQNGTNLNLDLLSIITESAKIECGEINGDVIVKTKTSSTKFEKITKSLTYDSTKGILIVGTIGGNFTCSESVVVSNISIDHVVGEVLLPSAESSNITIKQADSNTKISTTTGKIKIGSAKALADITTQSGTIEIVIDTDPSKIASLTSAITSLKTNNGEINAYYKNIVKENIISTISGAVNTNYEGSIIFVLGYNCETNAPTLSTGITTGTIEKTATFPIGCTESVNKLTISNAKGKTDIKDTLQPDYAIEF